MKFIIDGKESETDRDCANLVELLDVLDVHIEAPCYRAENKKDCCRACLVEVDGKEAYACGTRPTEGMNIIVDRPDLAKLRREKIEAYQQGAKPSGGAKCNCSCDSDCCG